MPGRRSAILMPMQIRFYNTLTRRVEPFEPIDPPHVFMYNCGPTVYDYAHIGNFKTFLFADVLRRFLELMGYNVHQVMNLTDVGHMTEDQLADGGGQDKMQVAMTRMKQAKKSGEAAVEDPSDPYQIAQFFADAFCEDAEKLGLKVVGEPHHLPRASMHIGQMQVMIEELIRHEHAYVGQDGAVYFSVQSFPQYGQLSGNTLDQLRGGAGGRVLDAHQSAKRHPADFLLWKPDKSHLMRWDSPWGSGYPGWHIECSAMALNVLGREEIDIHTGGEDNIFPHHECEIAQSCGYTGRARFARYWMHSRHLLIDGQKMSKSRGTFFTVRDVLGGKLTGEPVDPAVLRYELIKAHYRSQMSVSRQSIRDSASAVRKLRDFYGKVRRAAGQRREAVDATHPVVIRFCEELGDDLNMAGALASVFTWISQDAGDHDPAEAVAIMEAFDAVLDVLRPDATEDSDATDASFVADMIAAIDAARARKDYPEADRLRQELIHAGYDVKTGKDGSSATRRLA